MPNSRYDIVIVGDGVIGLSVALSLIREKPDLNLTVVGTDQNVLPGSTAAGAMLGCFGEVTRTLLSSDIGRLKLDLAVSARSLWPSWVDYLNDGVDIQDPLGFGQGTFVLLNSASSELDDENFNSILTAAKEYGAPIESVDASSIPGLAPLASQRPLRAIFLPNEGFVDSQRLIGKLRRRLADHPSVSLKSGHVSLIQVVGDRVEAIGLLSGETIYADAIVVAAGYASQALLDEIPELARRIPRIFPASGTAILTRPSTPSEQPRHVIRTPNRSFACGLHVVPRAENLLYSGATNHVRLEPRDGPTVYDVQFLAECITGQINNDFRLSTVVACLTGHRPVTLDGFPILGSTSIKGLWIASGTYREGLHLSPLLGQMLARSVLSGEDILNGEFKPERVPIVTISKQTAIEETVRHQLSIGYEHQMRVPDGWTSTLQEMLRSRVRSIYEAMETDFVLPPDLMPMVLESDQPNLVLANLRAEYRKYERVTNS